MNTYICEICFHAYLGHEKASDCPFCGARESFLKEDKEAKPILEQKYSLTETDKKNLEETLKLEKTAVALYLCMAGKMSEKYLSAMYKQLAKIEMEHAHIAAELLGLPEPEIKEEDCSDEDIENFKKTLELEKTATDLYLKFSKESEEKNIKIFFVALSAVEKGHVELIEKYIY